MDNIETSLKPTALPHYNFYDSDVYLKSKLIRIEEVSDLTTLGKSTINLWVAQERFPKPTLLSQTLKVWHLSEVKSWIESHMNGDTHD